MPKNVSLAVNTFRAVKKNHRKKPQTAESFTDNWAQIPIKAKLKWNWVIFGENAFVLTFKFLYIFKIKNGLLKFAPFLVNL